MDRIIPTGSVDEINSQESGDAYLIFFTLSHPELLEKIQVVTDPKDFVLDSDTFLGFDFNIVLLTDTEDMPTAQVTIQNVDRKVGDALERIIDPARVKLELIALSEFDTTVDPRTELGVTERIYVADHLFLIDIQVNNLSMTGRLVSWDFSQEPYPGIFATQDRFPGLFK